MLSMLVFLGIMIDPRKKLADAITKRETDKAAGIEKLKGLGLTADEATAVSS